MKWQPENVLNHMRDLVDQYCMHENIGCLFIWNLEIKFQSAPSMQF